MPQTNNIQNVFLFTNNKEGFTNGNPGLLIRSPSNWNKGPMIYTDWTASHCQGTKNINNMIYWKKKIGSAFTPCTKLGIHKTLKDIYKPAVKKNESINRNIITQKTKRERKKHARLGVVEDSDTIENENVEAKPTVEDTVTE